VTGNTTAGKSDITLHLGELSNSSDGNKPELLAEGEDRFSTSKVVLFVSLIYFTPGNEFV
jgi:hypothetical protein